MCRRFNKVDSNNLNAEKGIRHSYFTASLPFAFKLSHHQHPLPDTRSLAKCGALELQLRMQADDLARVTEENQRLARELDIAQKEGYASRACIKKVCMA